MLLTSMQDVSCYYGTQAVLAGASFKLSAKQRVGLIGRNGAGKTTILRLLLGQELPTSGTVVLSKATRVGYVPQHVEFATEETVLNCVLAEHRELSAELRLAEARLAESSEADIETALARFQRVRDAYDAIDGDQLPQRAEAMLDGLGLAGRGEQLVGQLSGGEKVVVSMARALLAEPDLLILDEPGNHLDYQGLDWLIEFLNRHRGAILVVSHNRYLLDRVVDGIFELENGRISFYEGGYSSYRSTKLRNLMAQQADYVANQKRLGQLEQLVKRFEQIARANSDPAWGKRLRARRSQLEREKGQAVERPVLDEPAIRTRFAGQGSKANIALQIRDYSKAYGSKVLLDEAELDISCGERVAMVGPNGCGKTSLIRDIVEHGSWDSARIRIGPSLTVGYGAQEKESGSTQQTLLKEIKSTAPMTDGQAFALLAKLNFAREDMEKKLHELSGGERNRLQLAKLMVTHPNFLVLDEPTNHLDIQSREAVEEALQDFEGTLLVVSHDRYFLEKVAHRVVEFEGQKLASFPGSFSEYWETKKSGRVGASSGRATKRRQQREKTTNKRLGHPSQELQGLERRIGEAEREKTELEQKIADAFGQNELDLGKRLQKRLDRLQGGIDELYARWEASLE